MQIHWLLFGVFVAVSLSLMLWRRVRSDHILRLNDDRRALCRLVGRGELVEGRDHILVALALSDSSFYYENNDLQGSLDLESVDEVEYDNELLTGHSVGTGRVLRLRSLSRAFEFVLDHDAAAKWQTVLPPVRIAR